MSNESRKEDETTTPKAELPSEYEAPRIESASTADDLDREGHYAGTIPSH